MTIEADIYKRLKNYSGLSDLIGTRLYPDAAPQNATKPYVVWETISTSRQQAISDVVASARPRIQFTAWADTWDDARAVIVQVRAAVLAMTGDTVTLHERSLENERSAYDEDVKMFWRSLDAMILHTGEDNA